jgi:NAD(P)-dependent dehydrogenase (short-subunit alcohol dehydrogenase family)
MSTVFVLGITSDIGRELAARLAARGWTVAGTHRAGGNLAGVPAACRLLPCDLASRQSVEALLAACRAQKLVWDLLVVAAGTEEPIGSFWECDPDQWDAGLAVNALAPLRVVRGLYPLRRTGGRPCVAFLSGAGTNNAAPAYSAYCAAKIFLIKMCELLDAESPDTSFFIIGPGIVRTKIHDQTLRAAHRGGPNYRKVADFLGSAAPGTSHDDIFACLQWCIAAGKETVGGRNISLVHDAWRQGGERLARQLRQDPDLYKLRRHGNDLKLPDQPS